MDDNGHSIKGSFTGKTTFYDATQSAAKRKVMRKATRKINVARR